MGSFQCNRIISRLYDILNEGTFQTNDCGIGKIFNETYNQCVDINECANSPCGACESCINTDGSYRCICSTGRQPTKIGITIELFQIFILDFI